MPFVFSSRLQRCIRRARSFSFFTLITLLTGCLSTAVGTPSTMPPLTDTWETLAVGIERRIYNPPNTTFSTLIALRIDPTLYTFRAHYSPGLPRPMSEWAAQVPGAVAFINANFFDTQHRALGLLISDGTLYSQPYTDRGGMLQVQNGVPRVRSTLLEPYLGEPLEQAVQAFPNLVTNGQTAFEAPRGDRVSRRTVVAQDNQGRILFLVTPLLGISLTDLAAYLPTTDMGIVNAVNMDGGGSTLLYLGVQSASAQNLASFDPVPTILAVYPR